MAAYGLCMGLLQCRAASSQQATPALLQSVTAAPTSQDEGGRLQTVVPVLSLAGFPDAAAAAQHMKALILAYPRTSAIIIREAGILCWGLMAHAQVRPDLGPCLQSSAFKTHPPNNDRRDLRHYRRL